MLPDSKSSNQAFTGIRGVAILLVLVSHFSGRGMGPLGHYADFAGLGRSGIYVFFVLSAFLCHQSLERHTNLGYFVKRFFRVLPSYWFVLAFLAIYSLYFTMDERYLHVDGPFWRHFLFIRGNGIFWSLPTEVFYYFLIPLVAYIRKPSFAAGAAIFFFLWYIFCKAVPGVLPFPVLVENDHQTQYLDIFLVGSLAFSLKDEPFRDRVFAYKWFVPALFAITAIGFAFMCNSLLGVRFGVLQLSREMSLPWGVAIGIFLIGIYRNVRQVTVLFDSRLLAFFGKYAYTLYLVHMIGLQTANSLNVPAVARFVIAFAIALGVAITLSYAIERPGIILGDKIIKAVRLRKASLPGAPASIS